MLKPRVGPTGWRRSSPFTQGGVRRSEAERTCQSKLDHPFDSYIKSRIPCETFPLGKGRLHPTPNSKETSNHIDARAI